MDRCTEHDEAMPHRDCTESDAYTAVSVMEVAPWPTELVAPAATPNHPLRAQDVAALLPKELG